jgi:hypothetical protein
MRTRTINKFREYEFPIKDFPNEGFHIEYLKFGNSKRKQQFLIHDKSGCPVGMKSCFGGYSFQKYSCPCLETCKWLSGSVENL